MSGIKTQSINKAFVLCRNAGQPVEAQVHGALDDMSARLERVGLTLEAVEKVVY